MRYESLAIHGGRKEDALIKGVNYPIYLSSTFTQDGLDDFNEFMYSRSNNPTRNNVEILAAELEGAKYGLAMSSGMAATALAFSLINCGEKVLINNNVYGGTWDYVSKIFEEKGINYEIVDDFNKLDFDSIDNKVTTIFVETPSNPLLDVIDIKKLTEKAKEKGIKVIVDNTFMTSYLQKPLNLGADIVVYSATKYYAGHSDIIAGLVVLNDDDIYSKLKLHQKVYGAILSPFESFLLTRGIKTLHVRMDRHIENTNKIATYFEKSAAIDKVYYTGLKSHKGYNIHKNQSKGSAAVLSVEINENYDYKVFCNELKIFDLAVSLGGVESLVCHPASMTHESYNKELQAKIGVKENLLRFSIGIENIDDLIEDLEKALVKSKIK